MNQKKALKATVRRSKRQLGADATPVELPVRKYHKKNPNQVVTDDDGNQDHVEAGNQNHVEPNEDTNNAEVGQVEENEDSENEEMDAEEEEVEQWANEEFSAPEDHADRVGTSQVIGEEEQPQQKVHKEKRKRGPTKMRKLAKEATEKVNVDFSIIGEHSGPGSVTLSSFLGPLVREHVPVLVDDWRAVDAATKNTMWDLIQARFNLDEGSHRESVFKQMGAIWRASKSRLVASLRKVKSPNERLRLKPSNIHSLSSWNNWVKSRTSQTFKVQSEKYRDLRKNQIPHTTSRKGMYRLGVDMKKKSADPRKVTRSKVWLAGHTHSDGRPVKKEFADVIERIQSIDSQVDSTATENLREDAVSQVLGKDRYGRVRGMGRGINLTKLEYMNGRDLHVQKLEASQADMLTKIEELQNQIRVLAGKKPSCGDVDAESNVSNKIKGPVKCKILDWYSTDDVVIGEGEFYSAEASYRIGEIRIGPNAAAIKVKSASRPDTFLWRPTATEALIGEAIGIKIPWPIDKIVLASTDCSSSRLEPYGSTASFESQSRCNIYEWNGSEIIAEGIICSVDPNEKINQIPLGPNAAIMKVVRVIDEKSFLWRPSSEMAVMGDAQNMTIAWPLDKISFIGTSVESPKTSPTSTIRSTGSTKKSANKCVLYDCTGSGKIVAEGRVLSTNPTDLVHFVPLGPNASKVMVDFAKIGDAEVWRPNSEIECIDDAKGSVVAWPNDKVDLL